MPKVAEYVLGELKPSCYFGENAPGFAGKIGVNVRRGLRQIGKKHGYTMSVFRTRSLLHGVPQVRERAFYFFWKGDKAPVFNFFNEKWKPIEDTIRDEKANFQADPINKKTPSADPYYRYVLEVIRGGMSHRDHCATVEAVATRGADMLTFIESSGHNYKKHVAPWMRKNGFEREIEKCIRRQDKLDAGGSVMRRGVIVPKDRIGAFVGHYPTSLTHPDQDRFITYREAMTIMGLPSSFELLDPKKSFNHICQNVPVKTATDLAGEVKASLEGKRDWVKTDYMFQQNHQQKTVENMVD
jgi:site-specific DNA-cytosine methylase